MFLVFTQHITPRLEYIVKTLLGDDAIITRDIYKFSNSSLQKINYSSTLFEDESLWIEPFGLLEETNVKAQQIQVFDWNGLPAFFKTNGILPFDIFSASFFLLTRYEEYTTDFKKDNYGNYHHTNSIAFKENFLQLPLINLWLSKLEVHYNLKFSESIFKVIPTYDIDIALAYKNHSLYKKMGGLLKDLFFFKPTFKERIKVLFLSKKDPYDVYTWLNNLHIKHQLQPIYFFLNAIKKSIYDKNPVITKSAFKKIIHQHSLKYQVGIHPSFLSNTETHFLKKEISFLQKLIKKEVNISRQHYVQLKFPTTYLALIKNGITSDFSMGYGTSNGFRASYAKPFYWYNLVDNIETNLLLHPFCYMDANCIFEQKLSPEKAFEEMKQYYKIVKKVNGHLIYIMHNHFLADQPEWQNWKSIYENFLTQIND